LPWFDLDAISESDFNLELALMSQFHHPNIVELLGFCSSPRCLLMKQYEVSLKNVIDSKRLSFVQAYKYILNITAALYEIHSKQIIHLDIKPRK
jgi:serine/threonine protein kinase